jgi:hypothetical protein
MIVVPDVIVDGYGRLLPVISAFRGDSRYSVLEAKNASHLGIEAVSVTITGPASVSDIEARFTLPLDLAFDRRNRSTVWLVDDGIGVTFRAPRFGILQGWRALEGEPTADTTAGDHTRH